MSLPHLQIETGRLLLRPPQIEDFERYAQLHADEGAMRFLGGPISRHAAWRKFLQMPGAWAMQGFAMFSVMHKDDGRWLGFLGPWRPADWPGNEVGYVFHPDAWGNGYVVEAAVATMDWSFDTLGWDRVIHCIAPGNLPSQKVAQRLGSTNGGPGRLPVPLDDQDVDVWGQTREQWRENRKRLA